MRDLRAGRSARGVRESEVQCEHDLKRIEGSDGGRGSSLVSVGAVSAAPYRRGSYRLIGKCTRISRCFLYLVSASCS